AAPFLFDRYAKEAERPELRPKLARKAVRAVDLGRVRRDLILGKVGHRLAQHGNIAAEVEIEPGKAVRYHLRAPSRRHGGRTGRFIDSGWLRACQRRNAPLPCG